MCAGRGCRRRSCIPDWVGGGVMPGVGAADGRGSGGGGGAAALRGRPGRFLG